MLHNHCMTEQGQINEHKKNISFHSLDDETVKLRSNQLSHIREREQKILATDIKVHLYIFYLLICCYHYYY